MFEYFWDQDAGLLLIDPPDTVEGIVFVVEVPGLVRQPLGYAYSEGSEMGVGRWFAVKLPRFDDSLRITVRSLAPSPELARSLTSEQLPEDQIKLVAGTSVSHGNEAIWIISRTPHHLEYEVYENDEQLPSEVVSESWTSRREGNVLYPAERGSSGGALPAVSIDVSFVEDDAIAKAKVPVEFVVTVATAQQSGSGRELSLSAYTLQASTSVERFLTSGDRDHLELSNRTDVVLKTGAWEQEIRIPERAEPVTAAYAPPTAYDDEPVATSDARDIDYLDRIVFEPDAPTGFVVSQFGRGTISRQSGTGLCLVYLRDGTVAVDDGPLGARLFKQQSTFDMKDLFRVEMENYGYAFDPSDRDRAGEISLLNYAEVAKAITSHYSSNLAPLELEDFLTSPTYYTLLAKIPHVEDLSFRLSAAHYGGGELSEEQLLALLSQAIIADICDMEPESPGNRRLMAWTDHFASRGAGWVLVPLALHNTFRHVVSCGLDIENADLGSLLSFMSSTRNAEPLGEIKRLSDDLSAVHALPMDYENQFFQIADLQARLRDLTRMHAGIDELVRKAERELSLPSDEQRVSRLAAFGRSQPFKTSNRAIRHIASRLSRPGLLDQLSLGIQFDDLIELMTSFFFKQVEDDFAMVNGIVGCGYSDPLAENVVPIASVEPPGFYDPALSFRGSLTPEQQAWLFNEDRRSSGLVDTWRAHLRADYEHHNGGGDGDRNKA